MNAPLRVSMAAFAHKDSPTGYGIVGVRIHEYLALAGAQILPGTEFGWDCVVAVSLPAAWPFPDGKPQEKMVWHTMFEVEPCPPDWVGPLNRCGLVWVPSQHSARVFREAGVTAPIMVSGYGIDPAMFYPSDRADHSAPYTFLVYGSALIGRKNVLRAIQAFVQADLPPDEAQLIVKVAAGMSDSYVQDEHGKPYPNIKVIAEDWRYMSQVADLLRSADCGIYLSAGEGWGLQVTEQMATGLPVICHNVTGMAEFTNNETVLPVRSVGQERSSEYEKRFGPTQYWQYVPDMAQTIDLIRFAFYNREIAAQVGRNAASYIHANHTWKLAGEKAYHLLCRHFAK